MYFYLSGMEALHAFIEHSVQLRTHPNVKQNTAEEHLEHGCEDENCFKRFNTTTAERTSIYPSSQDCNYVINVQRNLFANLNSINTNGFINLTTRNVSADPLAERAIPTQRTGLDGHACIYNIYPSN